MTLTLRPHQTKAVKAMLRNTKGQIIIPTGGGKTMCMINDAEQRFRSTIARTIVVVAPRILLANQLSAEFLEHITDVAVAHVHSGETHHFSTTNSIDLTHWNSTNPHYHKLIFTTYHSLHKIQNSMVDVDTIYFDEAHNSVQKNFFPATEHFSHLAKRCYFFTATP